MYLFIHVQVLILLQATCLSTLHAKEPTPLNVACVFLLLHVGQQCHRRGVRPLVLALCVVAVQVQVPRPVSQGEWATCESMYSGSQALISGSHHASGHSRMEMEGWGHELKGSVTHR